MLRFCSSEHSALRSTQGIGGAVQDQRLRASGAALHVSCQPPALRCTSLPALCLVAAARRGREH